MHRGCSGGLVLGEQAIVATPSISHRITQLFVEELEIRQLLSGSDPFAVEQLLLEELNDARANPAAYGASVGLDLSGVLPSQPLAFNPLLVQGARLHSQDMNDRGYFSHYAPPGNIDPGQRIAVQGFDALSWGESIAGGAAFPGPSDALEGLIIDAGVPGVGHRRHLLAIDSVFKLQNQVGIGIVQAGSGPLVDYYTIDTAEAPSPTAFITGVVMQDENANGKYDIGEGLSGITITVAGVGATTSFGSGGYSIAVQPGIYTVTASGGPLSAPIARQVVVGSENVRLNFVAGYDHFLERLYQTVLGRNGSPAEITGWLAYLENGGSPAAVASTFERSPEVESRMIRSWYASYLGRQPGGRELPNWIVAMQQGMTEEQVQTAILASDEFFERSQLLSATVNRNSAYLQSLYSLLLDRTPTNTELADWLAAISTQSRSAIVAEFIYSTEYRSIIISQYYAAILHRAAASPIEVGGWAISGASLFDIRVAFETSAEFMQI
jgi:hypothetical protein